MLFGKYNQIDQVKDDEMRRTCCTNAGEEDIGGKTRWKETTGKTKT
jgi:hypothetical protein